MSLIIAFLTLIILILTLLYQVKVWKIRALLSPGFYFSIIWISGLIGLILFHSIGILIEVYPEYIDELNILLSFTGISFIIVTKFGYKKVNSSIIKINYCHSFRLLKLLAFIYFLLALYVFFVEGSGFDFGEARNNMHQTIENRSFIVGYFRLLSIPLSIYSGSEIVKGLLQIKNHSVINYIFLILPFISDSLFSLTEGGRVAMVYGIVFYTIGAVLTMPQNFKIKNRKKLFFYGLLIFIFLNGMVSWIASVRYIASGNQAKSELIKESLGPFSVFHGAIEYVNSSYVGYQYRRVDAVSENLGYGRYTFNGFINWELPFSSKLGIENASIAKALDIYYHNQETYDYSRDYYYVTNSAYIPIIKDFSFTGSFFAIFFIVWCSHYFFVKIQKNREIKRATKFFFYYLFLIYWARSNFYGSLSGSILIPLYGFLIVDILNILTNKKSWESNFNN